MKTKTKRIIVTIIAIALLAAVALLAIRSNSMDYDLLDRDELQTIISEMTSEYADDIDEEVIRNDIKGWADRNGIVYTADDNGNILITLNASEGMSEMPTTVFCIEYDKLDITDNIYAIATMKYLSKMSKKNGPAVFIFANDMDNDHSGIITAADKYVGNDSNVIYMSSGGAKKLYINSYSKADSTASIRLSTSDRKCDTGIKIAISGLPDAPIDTSVGNFPNPLNQFSVILTRMNSKSITYEIADVMMANERNYCPTEFSATILINSYSVDDMVKYLDKRIRNVMDDYGSDYPEFTYTYEIIEDESALPDKVYSKETRDNFTNCIYTIKNGTYKFSAGQNMPEGYESGDQYGLNCIRSINTDSKRLSLSLYSAAINDELLNRILEDNATAAEFTGGKISDVQTVPAFSADEDLSDEVSSLYSLTNGITSDIEFDNENAFSGCSYIAQSKPDAAIIHLNETENTCARMTNMLLNYLAGVKVE